MFNKKIKVGMAQLLVEGGEPERNFQRAEKMVLEAAAKKCDIILLPECMDLAWTHPSAKSEPQPIPGPYSDIICRLAKENQIYICVGLTEKDPVAGKVFNAAILVNDKGEIILKYHKINLLVVEQPFYQIGSYLSVVETPFGLIGVNICADNYMDGLPIGHTLARMGAQIILSPSSWTVDYSLTEANDPYGEKWVKPFTILAQSYGLVIIGTTCVGTIVGGPYEGKKSIGCSLAVGSDGIIAQGEYNEFAGELILAKFVVPQRKEKGTEIGAMLVKKHMQFK
ncbi:MAG: carbon-nitrogen hydrolase family protein [Candidatus Omnitrophota bacterium]|nr:carbon-nitrogen hydrolase family protein [Candidatus Omnitrophota bacterium]